MAKRNGSKRESFTALTSTEEIVRDHLKASKALFKKLRASKNGTTKFFINVGILTKDGKRLAKRYR